MKQFLISAASVGANLAGNGGYCLSPLSCNFYHSRFRQALSLSLSISFTCSTTFCLIFSFSAFLTLSLALVSRSLHLKCVFVRQKHLLLFSYLIHISVISDSTIPFFSFPCFSSQCPSFRFQQKQKSASKSVQINNIFLDQITMKL